MKKHITDHPLARFSHGICPDCARSLHPDLYKNKKKNTAINDVTVVGSCV